jgi:hypothetical protein
MARLAQIKPLLAKRFETTKTLSGHRFGWGFHYVVGIAYAALYLAITRLVLASGPTLITALVFAIALLVVPWFVMQPALGLGFFAARTPHPSVTRIISISGHAAFGVGLYLGSISTSFL